VACAPKNFLTGFGSDPAEGTMFAGTLFAILVLMSEPPAMGNDGRLSGGSVQPSVVRRNFVAVRFRAFE